MLWQLFAGRMTISARRPNLIVCRSPLVHSLIIPDLSSPRDDDEVYSCAFIERRDVLPLIASAGRFARLMLLLLPSIRDHAMQTLETTTAMMGHVCDITMGIEGIIELRMNNIQLLLLVR